MQPEKRSQLPPGSTTPETPSGGTPDPADPRNQEGTVLYDQEAKAKAKRRSQLQKISQLPEVTGYRLLRALGEGTYGIVCLAEEERTGIRVAIKYFTQGTGQRWQLLQEDVKSLALLNADPGIIQLRDVNADATPPYYIMDYAEGGLLSNQLRRGPLPLAEALAVFRQVAEALAYVHAKGIRHCDLKPGNVLLDARGRALIGDFGQARLSGDATPSLGTFFYMTPEQADLSRQVPDTRWDVYGLGALLYAMLTGRPPRDDATLRGELENTVELSHKLRRYREAIQRAPRLDGQRRVSGMDRDLARIIDRCLEVDPGKRFHDAGAVLKRWHAGERRRRQRPMRVFVLVAPMVLVAAMSGVGLWAAQTTVAKSEETLTRQLLQSDLVSARYAANAVEMQMLERREFLEKCANQMDLRRALADQAQADQASRGRLLEKLYGLLKQFYERQAHSQFFRWTITDAGGIILTNYPDNPTVRGTNWSWREWFHGQEGDQHDQKATTFRPTSKPHISQPYVSKVGQQKVISISAPVQDPVDEPRIVGVLQVTIPIEQFYQWLTEVKIDNGFVVLLNERRHCLRHNDRSEVEPEADKNSPAWDCPTYRRLIDERQEGSTPSEGYKDPVDHETYLASFAPLRQIGWGVLIQHERQTALQPVDDLKGLMVKLGMIMVGSVVLLTSVMWGWLRWVLRREERKAHG